MLDTNALIDLVFGRSDRLDVRFSDAVVDEAPLFLSTISLYEFRFGAERSRRRAFQLEALERFLASVTVVNFDARDAERAALVKGTLAARGEMIGPYDLLIAAQALERDLALVSANKREFARVEGLDLEDWTAAPV
ncbi:MAG: PIN domain-containing protein [Caulobacterales bacterium]